MALCTFFLIKKYQKIKAKHVGAGAARCRAFVLPRSEFGIKTLIFDAAVSSRYVLPFYQDFNAGFTSVKSNKLN